MSKFSSLLFYIFNFLIMIFLIKMFNKYYEKGHIKLKNIWIFSVFIILTLISGTRYYVGSDYGAYINMYEHEAYSYLEIGSELLFKFSKSITDNSQFIIILFSTLTNLVILIAICRLQNKCNSSLIFASYLFLFLPFTFNIIRQSLAIAICFLAFTYLLDKKNKKAYILVIIAGLIHSSAFVLLIYFIVYAKSKEKNIYKNLLILFIVFILCILAYTFYFSNMGFFAKYIGYLGTFSFSALEYITLISYIPFFVLILLFKKTITNKDDRSYLIITIIYFIGCVFEFIFSSTEIGRFGLYFSLYNILLFPLLLNRIKNEQSRYIIKLIYMIFLVIYFVVVYYYHGRAEIFPYDSTLFH